tara:strand:+ start:1727 stop:2854 length:1128 start_codon:yes stop_codon:yes gene_type:complete
MKKSILFITGTRADFGKLEPLAKLLHDEGFDISFFITGMHMMSKYGKTSNEVKKFEGAHFFEFENQKENDSLEVILTKTISGFSEFIAENKPDLVVIHGDRIEALAASLVCAMKYIRSAHIEGGEISGSIDECFRHCNTKLCTTHFVSSELAANRVQALGEQKGSIFKIGSPELDIHNEESDLSIIDVKKRYSINFDEYGIVIFHPVTSEIDTIGDQAGSLFKALKETKKKFIVIAPNNDPGSEKIFSILNLLDKNYFKILPSMRFRYFSVLIKNASIFIGNSSTGIREVPFLGIVSIDIGSRQFNRSPSKNILNLSPFDRELIVKAINDKWGLKTKKSQHFGAGRSRENFVRILKCSEYWEIPLQKTFFDSNIF